MKFDDTPWHLPTLTSPTVPGWIGQGTTLGLHIGAYRPLRDLPKAQYRRPGVFQLQQ
ncbi:hypothetical protein RvY_19012 [Ramazzottius varieornatus]|uniref:Uncharacterized protein n=1 Tax=Ramazzottius varieornatus TaxID=947166 RepID=A0A1D1W969_RAMVA|nr:hypothetical protein RvY_19012 [Ramazzottius varieornatus]